MKMISGIEFVIIVILLIVVGVLYKRLKENSKKIKSFGNLAQDDSGMNNCNR
jgi:hypothetical protein